MKDKGIKRLWRYMKMHPVDTFMFLICLGFGVQWLIWKNDFTAGYLVVAFYVFNVVRRLGMAVDMIQNKDDESI